MEAVVDDLKNIVSRLEELRRNLTSYIMEGNAANTLEELSIRLSTIALNTASYTEDLNGLARRLKLLSTLAHALHNQWKHIHSRRVFGRINYLDGHLRSIIVELEGIIEDIRMKKTIRRIDVIRRIVF